MLKNVSNIYIIVIYYYYLLLAITRKQYYLTQNGFNIGMVKRTCVMHALVSAKRTIHTSTGKVLKVIKLLKIES